MERMTDERIQELENKGFKRWIKGAIDRLYVNAYQLGLNTEKYNSGNIRRAYFGDDTISNCEARRMIAAKTFVDVNTGRVFSDNSTLKKAVMAILGIEED